MYHDLEVTELTNRTKLIDDYNHAMDVKFNRPVYKDEYDNGWPEAVVVAHKWPGHEPIPFHVLVATVPESDTAILYWSEDNEERRIAKKFYANGELTVDWQMYDVGEVIRYDNAAPGIGHATFVVKRKDDTGLYGICIEDTRWIPDGGFYK